MIGRLGGEEFAVLLRGMTIRGAMECAERIRRSVAALSVLPDTDLRVTVSIGASAIVRGEPLATLADADAALYCAKESGRNRCVAMTSAQMPHAAMLPVTCVL